MRSIVGFDGAFPVRTVYTDRSLSQWDWDSREAREGLARVASFLGVPVSRAVCARETHSSSILVVGPTEAEDYMGQCDERFTVGNQADGFDGMVTAAPGALLAIKTADCVPVFLYDPVRGAAGIVHSGWRGTCGEIAAGAVRLLGTCFGSDPGDVLAAYGPCVCGRCYDVEQDVVDRFEATYSREDVSSFTWPGEGGKTHLDIKGAITVSLLRAGVKRWHIHDTGICTYETDRYPSRRRVKGSKDHLLSGIVLSR